MRRRLFNFAAVVSLVLCLAGVLVWRSVLQTHVCEGDRIDQQGKEIEEGTNRAPWGSQEYQRYRAKYNAWVETRNEYRPRESQERAAYHLRYIVLPRAMIIALAVLPTIWLVRFLALLVLLAVLFWKRCERAKRALVPPTRWRRLWQVGFTAAALVCFVLSVAIVAWWVRSHYVSDSFSFHNYFDEGGRTFLRQTDFQSGRGSIGVRLVVYSDSDQRVAMQRRAEDSARSSANVSANRIYSKEPAREVNFGFFPSVWRHLGFVWARARMAPPFAIGYERVFVVPFWSLQTVALAVALLWLWRTVRSLWLIQPGHCHCGYDLTGNVSGVCPEGGTPVAGKAGVMA